MRLRYLILFVSDIDRSVAFYRDLLGMKVREETRTSAELDVGTATLALHLAHVDPKCRHHPPMLAGSCRLGFYVDDLEEAHARLLGAGVTCLAPPEAQFDLRVGLYEDPDGNQLTLAQPITAVQGVTG